MADYFWLTSLWVSLFIHNHAHLLLLLLFVSPIDYVVLVFLLKVGRRSLCSSMVSSKEFEVFMFLMYLTFNSSASICLSKKIIWINRTLKVVEIQYRPKLIGLVFKLLLWPKYSSYRIEIGVNRKIMNWGFQNTSNLLRLLIPGPRKLSFKLEGRNLKCTFYLLIKFRPSTFKLNFLRPDMSYLKKLDVFWNPQFMIFRLTPIPSL